MYFLDFTKRLDSFSIFLESLLVIVTSLYYLYEQMTTVSDKFIYSQSQFWIVIGIFLYLAGTFFLFVLLPNMSDAETMNNWSINWLFNILKNILFFIGFLVKPAPAAYADSVKAR
jgi:hypothetical protein